MKVIFISSCCSQLISSWLLALRSLTSTRYLQFVTLSSIKSSTIKELYACLLCDKIRYFAICSLIFSPVLYPLFISSVVICLTFSSVSPTIILLCHQHMGVNPNTYTSNHQFQGMTIPYCQF